MKLNFIDCIPIAYVTVFFVIASAFLSPTFLCAQSQDDQYDGQITRTFTEPIEQSTVSSTETGILRKISIEEGDYVKAGQTLALLDNEILKQSLRMAKARSESTAQVDALRSRMKMLERRTVKVKTLVSGGHANPYEVEQIVAEFETATADLRAAEDELQLSKIEVERIEAQLSQRVIESPFDGFVVTIHKHLGELVTTTEPNFAKVVRLNQLKAKFYLKADLLDKLKVGSVVKVRVGRKKEIKNAVITYVAPIIDPDSGTGRLDIRIENKDLKIRSGTVCIWDRFVSQPDPQISKKGGHTAKPNPVTDPDKASTNVEVTGVKYER